MDTSSISSSVSREERDAIEVQEASGSKWASRRRSPPPPHTLTAAGGTGIDGRMERRSASSASGDAATSMYNSARAASREHSRPRQPFSHSSVYTRVTPSDAGPRTSVLAAAPSSLPSNDSSSAWSFPRSMSATPFVGAGVPSSDAETPHRSAAATARPRVAAYPFSHAVLAPHPSRSVPPHAQRMAYDVTPMSPTSVRMEHALAATRGQESPRSPALRAAGMEGVHMRTQVHTLRGMLRERAHGGGQQREQMDAHVGQLARSISPQHARAASPLPPVKQQHANGDAGRGRGGVRENGVDIATLRMLRSLTADMLASTRVQGQQSIAAHDTAAEAHEDDEAGRIPDAWRVSPLTPAARTDTAAIVIGDDNLHAEQASSYHEDAAQRGGSTDQIATAEPAANAVESSVATHMEDALQLHDAVEDDVTEVEEPVSDAALLSAHLARVTAYEARLEALLERVQLHTGSVHVDAPSRAADAPAPSEELRLPPEVGPSLAAIRAAAAAVLHVYEPARRRSLSSHSMEQQTEPDVPHMELPSAAPTMAALPPPAADEPAADVDVYMSRFPRDRSSLSRAAAVHDVPQPVSPPHAAALPPPAPVPVRALVAATSPVRTAAVRAPSPPRSQQSMVGARSPSHTHAHTRSPPHATTAPSTRASSNTHTSLAARAAARTRGGVATAPAAPMTRVPSLAHAYAHAHTRSARLEQQETGETGSTHETPVSATVAAAAPSASVVAVAAAQVDTAVQAEAQTPPVAMRVDAGTQGEVRHAVDAATGTGVHTRVDVGTQLGPQPRVDAATTTTQASSGDMNLQNALSHAQEEAAAARDAEAAARGQVAAMTQRVSQMELAAQAQAAEMQELAARVAANDAAAGALSELRQALHAARESENAALHRLSALTQHVGTLEELARAREVELADAKSAAGAAADASATSHERELTAQRQMTMVTQALTSLEGALRARDAEIAELNARLSARPLRPSLSMAVLADAGVHVQAEPLVDASTQQESRTIIDAEAQAADDAAGQALVTLQARYDEQCAELSREHARSRAAEETVAQLREKLRETSAALVAVTQRVDRAEQAVSTAQQRAERAESALQIAVRERDTVTHAQQELQTALDAAHARAAAHGDVHAVHTQEVAALQDQLAAANTTVTSLRSENTGLQAQVHALDSEKAVLQLSMEAIRERLHATQLQASTSAQELAAATHRVDALTLRVSDLERMLNERDAELGRVREVASRDSDTSASALAAALNREEAVQQQLTSVSAELQSLQRQLAARDADMHHQRIAADAASASLAATLEREAAIQEQLADAKQSVSTLQAELRAREDEVTLLSQARQHAESATAASLAIAQQQEAEAQQHAAAEVQAMHEALCVRDAEIAELKSEATRRMDVYATDLASASQREAAAQQQAVTAMEALTTLEAVLRAREEECQDLQSRLGAHEVSSRRVISSAREGEAAALQRLDDVLQRLQSAEAALRTRDGELDDLRARLVQVEGECATAVAAAQEAAAAAEMAEAQYLALRGGADGAGLSDDATTALVRVLRSPVANGTTAQADPELSQALRASVHALAHDSPLAPQRPETLDTPTRAPTQSEVQSFTDAVVHTHSRIGMHVDTSAASPARASSAPTSRDSSASLQEFIDAAIETGMRSEDIAYALASNTIPATAAQDAALMRQPIFVTPNAATPTGSEQLQQRALMDMPIDQLRSQLVLALGSDLPPDLTMDELTHIAVALGEDFNVGARSAVPAPAPSMRTPDSRASSATPTRARTARRVTFSSSFADVRAASPPVTGKGAPGSAARSSGVAATGLGRMRMSVAKPVAVTRGVALRQR